MEINIRSDKMKITDAIKSYAIEKLSKLDRYFEKPEEIKGTLFIKKMPLVERVEVTVLASRYTLRAEECHEDLYAAIDLVTDKLEAQIRKNKSKFQKRYQDEIVPDFNLDFETEETPNESRIVKRKNIEIKLMDEDEAILQMNLLNHDFFLFNNIKENCYSVVYLRKDGEYGIINAK
jgi:putative sigma-54 modulation protein